MAATAEIATAKDVVALLEDKEMTLVELRETVDDKAIGRAWAAGLIEFGQPNYCVQGPLGGENSILIFEGGVSWTREKTQAHKSFAEILKEPAFPICGKYERADLPMVERKDPKSGNVTYHRPPVKEAELRELLGLQVKLTNKGLATLADM